MSYVYPWLRDVYISAPPDTRRRLAPQILRLQKHERTGVLHAQSTISAMLCTTGSARRLAGGCRVPKFKVSVPCPEYAIDVPDLTGRDHLLACTLCTPVCTTVPRVRLPPRFAFHVIYGSHPPDTTPFHVPHPTTLHPTPRHPAPPHPRRPTTPYLIRPHPTTPHPTQAIPLRATPPALFQTALPHPRHPIPPSATPRRATVPALPHHTPPHPSPPHRPHPTSCQS